MLINNIPEDICLVLTDSHSQSDVLFDIETDYSDKVVPKRKNEFITGRMCARKALQHFGVSPVPIPIGDNREPLWPEGFVGSITHCEGLYAAAVARSSQYRSIGIDAENIQSFSSDVTDMILTDIEKSWYQDDFSEESTTCIIFSAKESVFKCLFPVVKHSIDFLDIEVSLDSVRQSFCAILPSPLATKVGRKSLEGICSMDECHVFTAVFLNRVETSILA
jgi:enterobactin synthetase component D